MKKWLCAFCLAVSLLSQAMSNYLVIDLSGGTQVDSFPWSFSDVAPDITKEACMTTQLWLRLVPKGTFTMGSPSGEVGRNDDEVKHTVTLSKSYFISVFPVTQKQWELVMGVNPSYYNNPDCQATRPVECVSYDMIRGKSTSGGAGWPDGGHTADGGTFMGVLRYKSNLDLDLPTEAQWERACRLMSDGTSTTYALNNGKNLENAEKDDALNDIARYGYDGGDVFARNSTDEYATSKVSAYEPNGIGLYGMHGNVWEWCLDWYGSYGSGSATDPVGATSGEKRVVRGGGRGYSAKYCRAATRGSMYPDAQHYDHGFRVVCSEDSFASYNLTVNLTPSTGHWKIGDDVYASGQTLNLSAGNYKVSFTDDVDGYAPPKTQTVRLYADKAVTFAYKKLYKLVYTLSPATATWTVDGKTYASGEAAWLPEGTYDVTFGDVEKYATHASVEVDVEASESGNAAEIAYVPISADDTYLVVDLSTLEGGKYAYRQSATGPDLTQDACRTTELWLRKVPKGSFTMGYPIEESDRYDYEKPHKVTFTKGFYVGVFELTQKQWELVMGNRPSYFKYEEEGEAAVGVSTYAYETRPVEMVSYKEIRGGSWPTSTAADAGSFMAVISERTGLAFDLPTESQWEYACRLKTDGDCYQTGLNSGVQITDIVSCAYLNELARYWGNGGKEYTEKCNAEAGTAKVGSYAASQLGLYDMHGNVEEFCLDLHVAYEDKDVTDPVGASAMSSGEAERRVIRGGYWGSYAQYCTAHFRRGYYTDCKYFGHGFRLVCAEPAN